MGNVSEKLKQYQEISDKYVKEFMQKEILESTKVSEFSRQMVENVAEFVLRGGKKLRSALIFCTYKLYVKQSENDAEILRLASFIELIHAFLLMHDDIMDCDSMRRGGKTMHKIYEEYAKQNSMKEAEHFGESMGMLAGDLTNMLALKMLLETNIDAEKKVEIVKVLSDQLMATAFGQAHDVLIESDDEYAEDEILMVLRYKTSKYTFETPMLVGAILAGRYSEDAKMLSEFAIPVGIAFQIRDDILGMFGDQEKTGKSVNSDIKEGKRTLLIAQAMKAGDEGQKAILHRYLGKRGLTQEDADKIRKVVKDTGSLGYSMNMTEKYVKKALEALENFSYHDSESWKFLHDIAEYMLIREL